MNVNPYEAPRADVVEPRHGIAEGPPVPWEIGEVVRLAWERTKANAVALIVPYVIVTVFSVAIGELPDILVLTHVIEKGSTESKWISGVVFVLGQVIAAYFQVGLARTWLLAARGGAPTVGMTFVGFDRFLPLLASAVMMAIAVVIGMVLFIVPGFIWALGFQFAVYYVVDANMGPVDALRASWRATRGQKGALFLFLLVSIGLSLAGTLACCVGLFVATPLIYVAHAIIFTRISGRAPATAWTDGGGSPPPQWQGGAPGYGAPPGGYGAPPGYGSM